MILEMITGGQRSGKSEYAEQRALALSSNPVYMATAQVLDEDFADRVQRHRQRRGPQWTTIEEPIALSRHAEALKGRVVLVDCVTLWCTNIFFSPEGAEDASRSFEIFRKEFDSLCSIDATFLVVTNEIGLGGVSANATQRHFTDLQGWANQYVARHAENVTMMISGRRLRV